MSPENIPVIVDVLPPVPKLPKTEHSAEDDQTPVRKSRRLLSPNSPITKTEQPMVKSDVPPTSTKKVAQGLPQDIKNQIEGLSSGFRMEWVNLKTLTDVQELVKDKVICY